MTTMQLSSILLGPGTLAVCVFLAAGCASTGGHAGGLSAARSQSNLSEDPAMEQRPVPLDAPASGSSVRIGGDLAATVSGSDADYRAGACRVDTPLPVGYPAPTPPGSIDLKTYPSVRLAEVTSAGDPDSGMNKAFWPLFSHIKKHDIAMTSPVEMNYRGMRASDQPAPESVEAGTEPVR